MNKFLNSIRMEKMYGNYVLLKQYTMVSHKNYHILMKLESFSSNESELCKHSVQEAVVHFRCNPRVQCPSSIPSVHPLLYGHETHPFPLFLPGSQPHSHPFSVLERPVSASFRKPERFIKS